MSTATRSDHSWLKVLLNISCIVLVFQFFPGLLWSLLAALDVRTWHWMWIVHAMALNAWWGLLATIDIRNWTWPIFAVLSGLAIVSLVGIKAWLDR